MSFVYVTDNPALLRQPLERIVADVRAKCEERWGGAIPDGYVASCVISPLPDVIDERDCYSVHVSVTDPEGNPAPQFESCTTRVFWGTILGGWESLEAVPDLEPFGNPMDARKPHGC